MVVHFGINVFLAHENIFCISKTHVLIVEWVENV